MFILIALILLALGLLLITRPMLFWNIAKVFAKSDKPTEQQMTGIRGAGAVLVLGTVFACLVVMIRNIFA